AEGAPAIGVRRDRKLDRTVERRHPDFAAEHGLIERHRQIEPQIAAVDDKEWMRRDRHRDHRVAGTAGRRPALSLEPDLLAAGQPHWNFDLDLLAGRQLQPFGRPGGGIFERDSQRGVEVAASRRLTEILWLELRRAAARASAKSAEHIAQDVLE